jgi:tetratricopeptide (TPR) repeat protein
MTRGRIFAYNRDGYLLFAFGGLGENKGEFLAPSAIACRDGKLFVADEGDGSITVFSFNRYGRSVIQADAYYSKGLLDESFAEWNTVLGYNSNFELAYAQLGRIYQNRQEYQKAMECFKKGNYRGNSVTGQDGYNVAFSLFRKQAAALWLPVGFACLLALYLTFRGMKYWRKRRGRP